MAGGIRIGVSGWRYTPWRGNFYPKKLAQSRELDYAARIFPSIELNGSFYSLQRPSSYALWADRTPPGFVFAIKGSRYITHMLKLRNVETALANFLASGLFELGDKRATELYQSRYTSEQLDRWAECIRAWSRGGQPADARLISNTSPPRRASRDVFCYFDNTDKLHAPVNARELMEKLGLAPASGSQCSSW